jgi:hypothetical protein
VAYRRFAGAGSDGQDVDAYQVRWDEPPQYGSLGRVRHALVDQALSRGSAGHGSERERKLRVARNMLDQGVISRADYDRMIAGL